MDVSASRGSISQDQAEARIQRLSPVDLSQFWKPYFHDSPDPRLALIGLERWLATTGNPSSFLAMLADTPRLSSRLGLIFGSSQVLADLLVQNPELFSLVYEFSPECAPVDRAAIVAEGRVLLSVSTSYSHALDRIRFLKQKHVLSVVLADISGSWQQEVVWKAISDIALAILDLAKDVVWDELSRQRAGEEIPLMIVAFGKLGGRELNYSSDVDLVFVRPDSIRDRESAMLGRFCETFSRALSQPMGRGSLYRVDLRLRPFGSAGSIAATMGGIESYYRLHAQMWEVQALLRTAPVAGPDDLQQRWRALVENTCFKPGLTEVSLDEILSMRERSEEAADPSDIKRGRGGIRDIEFLTQILQLLNGYENPEARAPATCDALRALAASGALENSIAWKLIDRYTFFRKLEHRLQLDDRQTHMLPSDIDSRERVARLMDRSSWIDLANEIDDVRAEIRRLYEKLIRARVEPKRESLFARLGPMATDVRGWFDALPEPEAFYECLGENQSSLERVRRIALHAPTLIESLKRSVAITEAIASGEIEEAPVGGADSTFQNTETDRLGPAFHHLRTSLLARWTLTPSFNLGVALAGLADRIIMQCCARLGAEFDLVALGSYALEAASLNSDADILLLVEAPADHESAEKHAQELLELIGLVRRHEPSLSLDLRLRPEGGKGLLVRTYDGLKAYDLEAMEMWERFALGQNRLVRGRNKAIETVRSVAYALPLTPKRLNELLEMKSRIEEERVSPPHRNRDPKLGQGSLSDIEWLVHLYEMRYPTATRAVLGGPMPVRLERLASAQLINALELQELVRAWAHLSTTRHRLALLGYDLIPENPDKLARLASSAGYPEGNAFLAYHSRVIEGARSIYKEGLDRLRA